MTPSQKKFSSFHHIGAAVKIEEDEMEWIKMVIQRVIIGLCLQIK